MPNDQDKLAFVTNVFVTGVIVGVVTLKKPVRDHPFKTSACLRGGGVKNLPNLPTDSTKKLPTVGG